jgi:hypothetical protein
MIDFDVVPTPGRRMMPGVWELRVTRQREDKRGAKRRTVGKYQVFHDGSPVAELTGTIVETRGPGDNSHAGNNRRIKAGTYPLRTHSGPRYATIGFTASTSPSALKRPSLEVGNTAPRDAILIHPGRGFLSSVGCFNPSKGVANAAADINFADSRLRTIALINDLKAFAGASFPTSNNRPIPQAAIVIEGEPSA